MAGGAPNPFEPPEDLGAASPPPGAGEDHGLASRGSRLLAAIIDGGLSAAVFLPLVFALGIVEVGRERTLEDHILGTLVGLAVFVAMNGWFWYTRAQSIGKIALRIRIVMRDGTRASGHTILFRRVLPVWLVQQVPFVGPVFSGLVDPLFIFRSNRACLHDDVAGTKVVRATAPAN